MTLLVAAVEGNNVWMVADTAITGGNVDLRDREHQLKVIPSRDGRALLGFAGEPVNGAPFGALPNEGQCPPEDAPWTLAFGHNEDRTPTHGYEPTREAAMAAFATACTHEARTHVRYRVQPGNHMLVLALLVLTPHETLRPETIGDVTCFTWPLRS
jgi:hypothetical protein